MSQKTMPALEEILETLKRQGIEKIIAFLGGSELKEGLEYVDQSLDILKNYSIAVLTGGTSWGLPEYSSISARKAGLPVIGIYPKRGSKYVSKNLDFAVEVESKFGNPEWGDSTEVFVKIPQGAEIIGGGMGTLIEAAYIFKINEGRIKNKIPPIYVAPISGIKGVSEQIYDFDIPQEIRKICLPESKISNGFDAAIFLIERLELTKKAN